MSWCPRWSRRSVPTPARSAARSTRSSPPTTARSPWRGAAPPPAPRGGGGPAGGPATPRARAGPRAGPAARAGAEQQLSLSLDRLFALADAYADLRGNGSFATLQAQLTARDDQVAYGRQFYNTAVQAYASATESLPTRVVARLAGFTPPEFFDTTDTPGPASLRR